MAEAVEFKEVSAGQPVCFCGSRSYRRLLSGNYDRLLLENYAFEVVECVKCGLARTLPVPDPQQYEQGYALSTKDGRFVGAIEDGWSAQIIEGVRSLVPEGRLLDVGCHVGNLVAAATARGYDAEGIDLDPVATAEGRRQGRAVFAGRLEELAKTYDVVVMNQVLEHVLDLRTFLAGVARVLAPEGHLFVFVPYHRGLMPRLMGSHWIGWFPSQHVWNFTPASLTHVVHAASSLRLMRYTTKGVIEPPSTGSKGMVKAIVAAVSRTTHWGDEIEAVFQKQEGAARGR